MTIKLVPSGSTVFTVALVSFLSFLTISPSVAETPSSRPRQVKPSTPKEIREVKSDETLQPGAEIVPVTKVKSIGATLLENAQAEASKSFIQGFVATAYSLRGRTATGQYVSKGMIAADRKVLPLGSRVRLEAGNYSGEYTVTDTGARIRGRKIDIWMPSSSEAFRFGRRLVKLTVLNYSGRSRNLVKKDVLIRAKR